MSKSSRASLLEAIRIVENNSKRVLLNQKQEMKVKQILKDLREQEKMVKIIDQNGGLNNILRLLEKANSGQNLFEKQDINEIS